MASYGFTNYRGFSSKARDSEPLVGEETLVKHAIVVCFYYSNETVPEGCCVCGIFCNCPGGIRRYIEGSDIGHVQIALRLPWKEKKGEVYYISYSVDMQRGAVFGDPTKQFTNWKAGFFAGFDASGQQLIDMYSAAQKMIGRPFSYMLYLQLYLCPSWGRSSNGFICIRLVMEILHAGGMYLTLPAHSTSIPTLYFVMVEELSNGLCVDLHGHYDPPHEIRDVIPNPMLETHKDDMQDQLDRAVNRKRPKPKKTLLMSQTTTGKKKSSRIRGLRNALAT